MFHLTPAFNSPLRVNQKPCKARQEQAALHLQSHAGVRPVSLQHSLISSTVKPDRLRMPPHGTKRQERSTSAPLSIALMKSSIVEGTTTKNGKPSTFRATQGLGLGVCNTR